MAKIRAIRMEPGKIPVEVEIGSDLRSLQNEVNGYISMVSLDATTDAFVNDEGLLMQLPFNCFLPVENYNPVPVVGNVIVVSHDNEGETTGLTDSQIQKWMPRLMDAPRTFGVEYVL